MTLLITVFAAIFATIIWYTNSKARKLNIGLLCLIFWGASLMWFVDTAVSYLSSGADIFHVSSAEMLDQTILGLSVTALALVIWLMSVLMKDPLGTLHAVLMKKHNG